MAGSHGDYTVKKVGWESGEGRGGQLPGICSHRKELGCSHRMCKDGSLHQKDTLVGVSLVLLKRSCEVLPAHGGLRGGLACHS